MNRTSRKEIPQATSQEMANETSHDVSSQQHGYGEQYNYSPPPTQLKPSKGLPALLGRLESETWLVEMCSIVVSLLTTALIVFYLNKYDGGPSPVLPKDITLNALLSVAITIIVVTITLPISSGLGQLNWIRARDAPVSLFNMNTMDQGTRGVVGAGRVILTWAGGPIGALGALTVILALIVPPLAQQSILLTQDPEILAFEQPTISRCNGSTGFLGTTHTVVVNSTSFTKLGSSVATGGNPIPPSMVGESYSAIYNNYVNSSFSADFATCSGNCTYKPFVTLTLCSKCVNITESLVKTTDSKSGLQSWRLSDQAADSPAAVSGLVSVNVFNTNHSSRISSSFATALLFAQAQTKGGAMECAMSFCVQVINAKITNGLLSEDITESYDFDNGTITGNTQNMTIMPPIPAIPGSPFTEPITLDLQDPLWIKEAIDLQGKYGPSITVKNRLFEMLMLRGVGNLTETMNDMAMGMGRAYRTNCPNGVVKVTGTATHNVLKVKIRWLWMIAPLLVQALGLIFFLTVVWLNMRSSASLWKTSFLAPCFHGMKLESSAQPVSLEKSHEMNAIAEVKVQLLDDPNGTRSRLRY